MTYELWETESGNLMASFNSEAEALCAVANRARRHGQDSVSSIALIQVDDEDLNNEMTTLATGADLLIRAEPPSETRKIRSA